MVWQREKRSPGAFGTEDPAQHQYAHAAQDHLGDQLGKGQAVQRVKPVEQNQQGDFQHQFAADGKQQGVAAHAQGLEHAHRQEVGAQEHKAQAHHPQEPGTVVHDLGAVHKGADHGAGNAHAEQVIHGVEGQRYRVDQGDGGVFHRVVEHADKEGVGQIVQNGDQGTDDDGQRKLHDGPGDRHALKQVFLVLCFVHGGM